jgi:Putative GTPase activating protein for Arf
LAVYPLKTGNHRGLGTNTTRVKSSKLDKWTKEWIDIVEHVGNKLANDFYEFKIPTDQSKPDMNSSDEARRK